jgi:ribose transport system ATP-binding protein
MTSRAFAADEPGRPPALELLTLSKSFGGQKALDNAALSVKQGEVHGLLGTNGSGKSTLIKILAGFHAPDAGSRLLIRGEEYPLPLPPGGARKLGLSFVHQHLGLIPSLSVLDNMMLGRLADDQRLAVNWPAERRRCVAAMARYGVEINPRATVSDLQPVERALLAIVRAVEELNEADGSVLVLDEPTPFLPRRDVERLFSVVRRVAAEGAGVIFVSHDVDEVMEITHRCTILRDGRVAGVLTTSQTSKAEFVERIIGRKLERHMRGGLDNEATSPAARVVGLSGEGVDAVSIDLRPGEVIGLTGLVGSGYANVPYLMFGAKRADAGYFQDAQTIIDLATMTPANAIRLGIVLIPGDRANAAVIGTLPITDNVTMPLLGNAFPAYCVARSAMTRLARDLGRRFEVMPNDPLLPMNALSGGNQQKVVLAKWLQTKPSLVLLDEPTQGVDVGARSAVFSQIQAATDAGAMVLCASSDYEQLEQIADRVLIFAHGRIVAELKSPAISKTAIAELCYTHSEEFTTDTEMVI